MENEKLIQEFIKQFTGDKRREVEQFLKTLINNQISFAEAIRRTTKEFDDTQISVGEIADSIESVLKNLSRTNTTVAEGRKSFKKLQSITRTIQDDQAGIYQLSLKELRSTKARAQSEIQRLKYITNSLRIKARELGGIENLQTAEQELARIGEARLENQRAILDVIDERIVKEKSLESALGLTGAVLDNLNKIGIRALGGIGINLGTLQDAFDDARDTARRTAEEIEAFEETANFSDFSKRFITLNASLRGVGKGIQEAFNDPLTLGFGIFTRIVEQVFALNEAQNKFRRLAGRSADAIGQISSRAVTAVDLLNTMASITEKIGLQANAVFNTSQLVNIAEAQELLGLSLDQATQLATASKLTGRSQEEFNNGILRGVDAANSLYSSVVAPGVALRDAANASADIVLSLGMASAKLGRAATAARALGIELSKLSSIADTLLDFESSIQNELEAQLLIGKEINLNRAREFALVNDLEGVARELAANNVTAAEFAGMTRIAQDGIAKALGMSREELGKTILQQSLASSLTDEQRASVLGINQAQLEQLDISKSIEKSLQSITQSLAGPLELLASILEKSGAIYAIIGTAFAAAVVKFGAGLYTALTSTKVLRAEFAKLNQQILRASLLSQGIGINKAGRFYRTQGPNRGQYVSNRLIEGMGAGSLLKGGGQSLSKSLLGGAARAGAGALSFFGGPAGLAALAAIVGGGFLIKKLMDKGDDVVSTPGYGDRLLLDKGTITSLNNKDTLIAGTNLGSGGGNRRTEQLLERLVAAVEKGGNVYIDGNEAGKALVMGTYKI